jgi:hypothetical protein
MVSLTRNITVFYFRRWSPFVDTKDCLVYPDLFEESLIKVLGGNHCEIHTFDLGNYARPGGLEKNNIYYHQCGLKSSYDNAYNAQISLNALKVQHQP